MTPESHSLTGRDLTGTDDSTPTPPPGCPAHGRGPGGAHRLYGPEAEDLGALYEKMRAEHGAVAPALLHDDVPIWVVLGHSENLHMVRSPAQFTRDSRVWAPLMSGEVKPDHPLSPHFAWQPICSHVEGDEHLRLRGAVTGAVSTIDYRGLRRHINRATQMLVNRFCETGRADLVGQFADHLPMAVMCEVLGMADEYNDRIVQAARDMLKGTETAIASNQYIVDALTRLTARRRAQPEDDFTSHLVNHPAALTDGEIREHLRVVLIAAYEATANLLANVLRVILTDPRFRAQLNGGQMTVPEAVEQSLWDEPPFSSILGYYAKQDTELGGRRIRKGDGLLLGIAPGNVDPRVRPDLSANMQGNRSHLAFGGGPHECPGQDIGRAIADTGIDALLMRLPDIRLDCGEDALQWTGSIASRHLVELPVRFEPRPPQDTTQRPSLHAMSHQRPGWLVATPGSAATAPVPEAAPPVPPVPSVAPAPPERPGVWQRLVRWWRGE
ncbi:2-hydroxy-5-methyl-1-naphthoate 7-hydroxylase [Streptomyces sp. MBT84]|uniref:cytochrome P450 n=1 Tax=unclassified Streptomyces TaxID=2593676 RepID=UPI001DD9F3D1|nr:cytochrome P450 [Streptomyces sp. MBT84]MBW8704631.1 2-hydroxy-5-methyl-1-naphthoate 7-hydroxylase [Streptomyces sp. MBT84]